MTKQSWRRASFTVEAAYLVPICATIIVLLLGYIYSVHEKAWASAAAHESGFYAVQRLDRGVKPMDRMQERIEVWDKNKPLPFGSQEYKPEDKDLEVKIGWKGTILTNVFGDRFDFSGSAVVEKIHAAKVRRTIWLANFAIKKFGKKEE